MTMNCQGRYSVVPNSIRGIWVWGTSISEYGIEKAVDEFKEMGITDVFLLVKGTMGRVCWPSKIALATSRDVSVLPRTRAACSENNLRFHAWFIITQDKTYLEQNWTSGMWGIPIESEPVQEYRLGEHRCFRISTAVVDFASDIRYKEYVLSLIAEVINDYAPDGIHLDYIRYPNGAWGWGPVQLQRAKSIGLKVDSLLVQAIRTWGTGGDQRNFVDLFMQDNPDVVKWSELKANDVRDFLQEIRCLVRRMEPSMLISAALIPEGGNVDPYERSFALVNFGQRYSDFSEACDFILPMAYHRELNKPISWVLDVFNGTAQMITNRSKIVMGIQAHGGISINETFDVFNVLKKSGADGICFFAFHEIFKNEKTKEFFRRSLIEDYNQRDISYPQNSEGRFH